MHKMKSYIYFPDVRNLTTCNIHVTHLRYFLSDIIAKLGHCNDNFFSRVDTPLYSLYTLRTPSPLFTLVWFVC